MKTVIVVCLLVLAGIVDMSAQYQASVVEVTSGTAVIRCVGYGKNAKKAAADAELSAIKTLLFAGIPDSRYSMPLIPENRAQVEKKFNGLFEEFYRKEYRNFIESSVAVTAFGKNSLKQKCITLDVRVRVKQLRTYFENNGVIRKFGL